MTAPTSNSPTAGSPTAERPDAQEHHTATYSSTMQLTPLRQSPTAPGDSGFCRVAVAGPRGRADLAVPTEVPLARLLPALLRHAGEEPGPDGGTTHGGWTLRRLDGSRLQHSRTLATQEVREGDVLFLTRGDEELGGPLYDDVVEVIGDEGVRRAWGGSGVRPAAAVFAALAVCAAAGLLATAPGRLPGVIGVLLALLALGLGALFSRAFGDLAAGAAAGVLAAPLAVVAAVRLLGGPAPLTHGIGPGGLLLACVVLAAIGSAGPVLIGGADGLFGALTTAGLLAAFGAAVSAAGDTSPARAAAVAAPCALAATTLLPALALRFTRVPGPHLAATADDMEQLPEPPPQDALRVRVRRARTLLTGMLAGSLTVVATGVLVLAGAGRPWPGVLAALLALLTLLRARLFKEFAQVLIPLAATAVMFLGAAAVVITGQRGEQPALVAVALPICLVVAAIAATVAMLSGRRGLNPRLARTLDVCETTLLLSVIPVVLAVFEVYTALLKLKA
ncbi:type VII secretion integral membrane protein EccD [Streptomyces sp. CB03238]|uniref:type VII secretion integral membrane protein EccD n=1 Tax=Streptomyces sp. CB03238 TaxID=1907777 RepID=UPI000A110186|nr:type VII secretion integral membrane protein EccD [Streptomyces sp. CB03238]